VVVMPWDPRDEKPTALTGQCLSNLCGDTKGHLLEAIPPNQRRKVMATVDYQSLTGHSHGGLASLGNSVGGWTAATSTTGTWNDYPQQYAYTQYGNSIGINDEQYQRLVQGQAMEDISRKQKSLHRKPFFRVNERMLEGGSKEPLDDLRIEMAKWLEDAYV